MPRALPYFRDRGVDICLVDDLGYELWSAVYELAARRRKLGFGRGGEQHAGMGDGGRSAGLGGRRRGRGGARAGPAAAAIPGPRPIPETVMLELKV